MILESSHNTPYYRHGPWSKVVYYVGNSVSFRTQPLFVTCWHSVIFVRKLKTDYFKSTRVFVLGKD